MTRRQRASLGLAPLLLRLAVGVTFVWAGTAKLFGTFDAPPAQAATLANLGVRLTPVPAPAELPPTVTPFPRAAPPVGAATSDGRPPPLVALDRAELPPPAPLPPAENTPPPEPRTVPPTPPAQPTAPPPNPTPTPEPRAPETAQPPPPVPLVQPPAERVPAAPPPTAARIYTASDFSGPMRAPNLARVALAIHNAANPPARADGAPPIELWPAKLARDEWPVRLAWTVAITELVAGVMVLIGLLTRLWSLALVGVMLGAIWLTTIGPPIAAGTAVLGFLPPHPAFDAAAWSVPLWQFTLLMVVMALVVTGSGSLALDNALFGRRHDTLDEHDLD